jgi:hypothetical protein
MRGTLKVFGCLAAVLFPCLLALPGTVSADEVFAPTTIIPPPDASVGGTGALNSFDIGFDDANIKRYALADRTNKSVDIINTQTNRYVKLLQPGFVGVQPGSNTSGPNGVIIVDHREVWAADGVSGTSPTSKLYAIDIKTGSVIQPVMDTGGSKRADELCEDVGHEHVLVANDDPADNFLTFWSSETHARLGKIKLDGTDPNGKITLTTSPATPSTSKVAADGIEQCKFNPRTGFYYLAVPHTSVTPTSGPSTGGPGVVLKISGNRPFHVVATLTIDPSTGCTGPQGLAIGPEHQIVLGCGNGPPATSTASLIIDDRGGTGLAHVVHVLAGDGGADEVWYNPGDNQYFIAASNHPGGPILGVADPDGEVDTSSPTQAGSHSVAADMLRNQVYVPGNAAGALCGTLNGCIAVFTARHDDACLAEGMPVLDHDDGDDPVFMRTRCHDDRDDHMVRNDHDR